MSWKMIAVFIIVSFVLRFLYGLGNEFIHAEDHQQIYALGLKFFTTGEWPYFGPDVVYTQTQIPGALQAFWIALPLWIMPISEAPYVLLTIAVVLSLGFLSWYLIRLELSLPSAVIMLWVGTLPWSIFMGSMLMNPAYVMIYAVFFMVAFYEIARKKNVPSILPNSLCFFLMGYTTLSIMQLHLSWVLLLPLIIGAWGLDFLKEKNIVMGCKHFGFFILGSALGGATLYPTLLKHGLMMGVESNMVFNADNYKDFFKTLFNFMYFPSYSVFTSMVQYSFDQKVIELMMEQWWTIAFFVIPLLFGYVQMGLYTLGLVGLIPSKKYKTEKDSPGWRLIRLVMIVSIFYTWISFFFNDSGSSPHKYFLFFPLTVIYSVFILEWAWPKSWFRKFYWVSLTLMLIGQGVIAFDARYRTPTPYSFHRVRDKISLAIEEKDYTLYSKTRYDNYMSQSKFRETYRPGY